MRACACVPNVLSITVCELHVNAHNSVKSCFSLNLMSCTFVFLLGLGDGGALSDIIYYKPEIKSIEVYGMSPTKHGKQCVCVDNVNNNHVNAVLF